MDISETLIPFTYPFLISGIILTSLIALNPLFQNFKIDKYKNYLLILGIIFSLLGTIGAWSESKIDNEKISALDTQLENEQNQIKSASAQIILEIEFDEFDEYSGSALLSGNRGYILFSRNDSTILTLRSSTIRKQGAKNRVEITQEHSFIEPGSEINGTIQDLRTANKFQISIPGFTYEAKVIKGTINLLVNGSKRNVIQIIPQRIELIEGDGIFAQTFTGLNF